MNIVKATRRFEEWLRRRTAIVEPDLRTKHKHMAEAAFPFLRATFHRWIQVWPGVCSDLAKAPELLAVGDLHIENFGTWRDVEGRLTWGINDFDECTRMPYLYDRSGAAGGERASRDRRRAPSDRAAGGLRRNSCGVPGVHRSGRMPLGA